jgi:hypothetical protein
VNARGRPPGDSRRTIDIGAALKPDEPVRTVIREVLPVLGVVFYVDHEWTDA